MLVETLKFTVDVGRLQDRLDDIRRKIRKSSSNETFRERINDSYSSTNNIPQNVRNNFREGRGGSGSFLSAKLVLHRLL